MNEEEFMSRKEGIDLLPKDMAKAATFVALNGVTGNTNEPDLSALALTLMEFSAAQQIEINELKAQVSALNKIQEERER